MCAGYFENIGAQAVLFILLKLLSIGKDESVDDLHLKKKFLAKNQILLNHDE